MTIPNDGTCVITMEYSEEEISAVLAESEQERKRLRKLGKVIETVAAYRLKETKKNPRKRAAGYLEEGSWLRSS